MIVLEWALMIVLATGAATAITSFLVFLYVFAVGTKFNVAISEFRSDGLYKGFKKLIWGQYI